MPIGHLKRFWARKGPATARAAPSTQTTFRHRFFHLGVSAKLQWAFGAVAGLTLLAAAIGLLSFRTIEGGLQRVVNVQMPAMTNAMRLSVTTGNISAAAARFISARTDEDRKETLALITKKRAELAEGIAQAQQMIGEGPSLTKVIGLSHYLDANLETLEEAISERTALRKQIEIMLDNLHEIHAQIIDELAQVPNPAQAMTVSARIHLLVSLVGEGSTVRDPLLFKDIQSRLQTASAVLLQTMDKFDDTGNSWDSIERIRIAIGLITHLSQGADSIFARRARELFAMTRVDAAIDENGSIQHELDAAVAVLVSEADASTQANAAGWRSPAFWRPAASASSMCNDIWSGG